jgi:hypothetical protein
MRAQVNEALMDLITDPVHWGTEDPQSPVSSIERS